MTFYGSERIQQLLTYLKNYLTEKFAAKQDKLTFDAVPTENSMNPVRSGGVYSTLKDKANISDIPDTSQMVHTTGDEFIGGIKKFTSSTQFNTVRSLGNNDPNFNIKDLGLEFNCSSWIPYGNRRFDVEIMQAPNQSERNPSKGYAVTYSGGTNEHPTEAWLLVDSTAYDGSSAFNRIDKGGILYIARTAFLEPEQGGYQKGGVVDNNYTIKINTDTKAVDFAGDINAAGNINVTGNLKKDGTDVSLAGHKHNMSEITDLPKLTWTRLYTESSSDSAPPVWRENIGIPPTSAKELLICFDMVMSPESEYLPNARVVHYEGIIHDLQTFRTWGNNFGWEKVPFRKFVINTGNISNGNGLELEFEMYGNAWHCQIHGQVGNYSLDHYTWGYQFSFYYR